MPPLRLWLIARLFWLLPPGIALAQVYQHPSGPAFSYPDPWTLTELDAALLLTHPDAPRDARGQPLEYLLVGAEALGGVTALDHPEVLAYFDAAAQSLLAGAQRIGPPEIDAQRALIRYGAGEETLSVRYRFSQGLGLYVAHRAGPEPTGALAAEAVFATFATHLKGDPLLLGHWYRNETSMTDVSYSDNGTSASYSSSSSSFSYVFSADQQVRFGARSRVYGQAESATGAAYISTGDGDPNVDVGTYTVSGNQLTILWAEGEAVTLEYSVFQAYDGGWALKLKADGEKPRFYRR